MRHKIPKKSQNCESALWKEVIEKDLSGRFAIEMPIHRGIECRKRRKARCYVRVG